MDIQYFLNLMLQVIVMSFVALMIFDFITGLWAVPLPAVAFSQPDAHVIFKPTTLPITPEIETIPNSEQLKLESQPIPFNAPQFEEIPDPWTLEPASSHSTVETQLVVLPSTTLRLLPPVQELQLPTQQLQSKRQRTKTNKPTKIVKTESTSKPTKQRKKAA